VVLIARKVSKMGGEIYSSTEEPVKGNSEGEQNANLNNDKNSFTKREGKGGKNHRVGTRFVGGLLEEKPGAFQDAVDGIL